MPKSKLINGVIEFSGCSSAGCKDVGCKAAGCKAVGCKTVQNLHGAPFLGVRSGVAPWVVLIIDWGLLDSPLFYSGLWVF